MIVRCPLSGSILISGKRVAPDVLFELGLAQVGPLPDVLPAPRVVEHGDGNEARVGDGDPRLAALVVVARVAHGEGVRKLSASV